MDKVLEITLLYDFYGELLTEKQRNVIELYYQDDYSLNEIGDRCGITRQAVHEMIKRTEKILTQYEEKLLLVSRYLKQKDKLASAVDKLDSLLERAGLSGESDFKELKSELDCILD
jgi:predicted DNA-binding protein YlxM (UPF0122 family)